MTTDALITEAFTQHRAGNLPAAEALYRQALGLEPDNLNALHMLGVLVLSTDRAAEAVALLERAAKKLAAGNALQPMHTTLFHNLGNAQLAHGQAGAAAANYQQAVELDSSQTDTWCRLGNARITLDQLDQAAAAFRGAMKNDPQAPAIRLQLAQILHLTGAHEEAADLLRQLAKALPAELVISRELARVEFALVNLPAALAACRHVLIGQPDDADMLFLAGRIEHQQLAWPLAEQSYRKAVQARPDDVNALAYLALLLQEMERPDDTAEVCQQVLRLQPDHANTLCILGWAQREQEKHLLAIDSFRRALRAKPDFAQARINLGQILASIGQYPAAEDCFAEVIARHPDNADALIALGNLIQARDPATAHAHFRHAHAVRPLTTVPPIKQPAEFAVLLIVAPGVANTPTYYLVGKSNYDAHFLCLLPGIDYDIEMLRKNADVVVNLLSDADQAREMLPLAKDLVDRLGLPIINHPDKISPTDRATVASLLADIPGCRVPRIIHFTRAQLLNDPATLASFSLPMLLRVAGKHGGDDFDLINDLAAVPAFVEQVQADDYYGIDYIDYSSADGHFRKYRLIFTDGRILPYHLAIGDSWKVHHYTTDMGKHQWMQDEEAAFLARPEDVFNPANYASLRAIQAKVGLDYFGIDCSLDQDGNVVVFEVNASMLVHNRNDDFPYKDPFVAIIKQAFDNMLQKVAQSK